MLLLEYFVILFSLISKSATSYTAVDESRYFILSRYNGQVVAAEAPLNISEEWPASFSVNGIEYFPLEGHDTFFFWDELRNAAGSTVGYTFLLPESPAFRNSAWVQNSGNVVLDGEEVRILLGSCDEPVWECVQGFGSDVYVNKNDQSDCIIYMLDFSENPIAFSLHSLS